MPYTNCIAKVNILGHIATWEDVKKAFFFTLSKGGFNQRF